MNTKFVGFSGLVISLVWLTLSADHIGENIGWDNLFSVLPHELAIISVGVFAPLAFIWLVLAYFGRGGVLKETANDLRSELRRMTYPFDDAEQRVKVVSEALRGQAQQLSAVSDRAISQAQHLHEGLRRQTEQLEVVAERLTEKAKTISDNVERQTEDLDKVSVGALERLTETAETVASQIESMGPDAERAASRVLTAASFARNQSDEALRSFGEVAAGLTNTGETLRDEVALCATHSETAINKISGVCDSVQKHAGEMTVAADQALETSRALGDTFRDQAEALSNELKSSINNVDEVLDSFRDRSEQLAVAGRDAVSSVNESSARLREEVIILKNDANTTMDRVSEVGKEIRATGTKYEKQVRAVVDSGRAQILEIMESLDTHVGRANEIAEQVAIDALTRIDKFGDAYSDQSEAIANANNKTKALIDDGMKEIQYALEKQQSSLDTTTSLSLKKVKAHANEVSKLVVQNFLAIEGSARDVLEKSEVAASNFRSRIELEMRATTDLLDDTANDLERRVKQSSESLDSQFGELKLTANNLIVSLDSEIERVREMVTDQATKVAYLLEEVANNTERSTAEISRTLHQQNSEFEEGTQRTVAEVNAKIKLVIESLKEEAKILEDVAATSENRGQQIGVIIHDRAKDLKDAVEGATEHVETLVKDVTDQVINLNECSQNTINSLGEVGKAIETQSTTMKEAAISSASQIADVMVALRDQQGVLQTSSSITEQRIAAIAQVFREHARELSGASDSATRQVDWVRDALQTYSSDLTKALDSAVGKVADIGGVFQVQANSLQLASKNAEDQARLIETNTFDSRRDQFLRASRFIIEDLNSTAIDLGRIIDQKGSRRLWKRLRKGEAGAFVRGILAKDENKAEEIIRNKFADDSEFRKYTQRYLDHFERLLSDANRSDPENLLSTTFLSADIGKLYIFLARSVGRLDQ